MRHRVTHFILSLEIHVWDFIFITSSFSILLCSSILSNISVMLMSISSTVFRALFSYERPFCSFSSYNLALAPKFRTKNARVNVEKNLTPCLEHHPTHDQLVEDVMDLKADMEIIFIETKN